MNNGIQSEGKVVLSQYVGKTVASAEIGDDSGGYTMLVIQFTDGTRLVATEESQSGYFLLEPHPV